MKARAERLAIRQINQILDIDQRDRDALPGSVVKLLKEARTILRKRERS